MSVSECIDSDYYVVATGWSMVLDNDCYDCAIDIVTSYSYM